MTTRETIVARVQKLLAFTDETATEAEVQNAMALAQRLMEQHAIEQADLEEADTDAGPVFDRHRTTLKANIAAWEAILANTVQMAVPGVSHYADTVQARSGLSGRTRRQAGVVWFGPADLVEVATLLFEETRALIATMAAGQFSGLYRGRGRSYALGFVRALLTRVQAERSQSDRLGAIVLASQARNKEWLRQAHGIRLQVTNRRPGQVHPDAFSAGQRDGRNADFTPGRPTAKLAGGRRALPPA